MQNYPPQESNPKTNEEETHRKDSFYLTEKGRSGFGNLFQILEQKLASVVFKRGKGSVGPRKAREIVGYYLYEAQYNLSINKEKALEEDDIYTDRFTLEKFLTSATASSEYQTWLRSHFLPKYAREDNGKADLIKIFSEAYKNALKEEIPLGHIKDFTYLKPSVMDDEILKWLPLRTSDEGAKKKCRVSSISYLSCLIADELRKLSVQDQLPMTYEPTFYSFARTAVESLRFLKKFGSGKSFLKALDDFAGFFSESSQYRTALFQRLPSSISGAYGFDTAAAQHLLHSLGYSFIANDEYIRQSLEVFQELGMVSDDLDVEDDIEAAYFFEKLCKAIPFNERLGTLGQKKTYIYQVLKLFYSPDFYDHYESLAPMEEGDVKNKQDFKDFIQQRLHLR